MAEINPIDRAFEQGQLAGVAQATTLLLTNAVKLQESGFNHDSGIVRDAAKLIEADFTKLQHSYSVKYGSAAVPEDKHCGTCIKADWCKAFEGAGANNDCADWIKV